MAILECVIFLLILNMSICDKYEPKLDDTAPSVQVSHYDWSEMTENNLYSLNQVKPCNMAPQNIQMNDVKLTMYTKHFRTEMNATICRIKHQRNKFYCGMHDHTSMDIEQPQITSDIDLTPEQCKQASEGKSLTLFDHKLTFEKGKKEIDHKIIGDKDDDNRNECDGYEWIIKDTFESHIQDITLKVRIKDGKIFNRNDQLLLCDLDELGCESTSLDPYAYTCKAPETCILSVLKEDYAHMLKNDNHYYIVSQNTSENKYLFEVKNHPQHLCNKPTEVYPTTYNSMSVAIHYGGFDMKTGRKLNELGPHLLQYQNNAFLSKPGNHYVYSLQPKPADPYINTWLNMDDELQQGTKLDYLFFESSRALQASELNLLKNQCEQERIQIFTILMLSLENPTRWIHAHWKQINVLRDRWKPSLALLLSTSTITPTYPQPMLWQDTHPLQRTNTVCRPHYQTNLTRCFATKLFRPDQELIPNGYGPKRLMVLPHTWNHPQRQTCSFRRQRHISLHYAKIPSIS